MAGETRQEVEPADKVSVFLGGALAALPQGFSDVLQAVFTDAKVRQLRPASVASRVKAAKHLLSWAAKIGFSTISPLSSVPSLSKMTSNSNAPACLLNSFKDNLRTTA